MRPRSQVLRALLLLFSLGLLGLGLPLSAQEPFHENLTTADGLPSLTILDLGQDESGRIWILDRLGVTVYDGTNFKSYSTADGIRPSRVGAMVIDETNRAWVVSGPSLVLYRFDADRWYSLAPAPSTSATANAHVSLGVLVEADRAVAAVASDDGLWLWTQAPDGSFPRPHRPYGELVSNRVTAMTRFGEKLAVGTANGLCFLNFEGSLECGFTHGKKSGDLIRALLTETMSEGPDRLWILAESNQVNGSSSSAWLGYLQAGELVVDLKPPALAPLLLPTQPRPDLKTVMLRDQAGGFYFGTDVTFSYLAPDRTQGVKPLHLRQRLPTVGASSILLDREFNIWIGGPRGLVRVGSQRFLSYDQDNKLVEDEVTSIIETSPGNIILGHNLGLTFLDGAEISTHVFELPSNRSRNEYRVLGMEMDPNGDVWLATSRAGLLRLDAERRPIRELPEASVALAVTRDRKGQLWVAAPEGLFSLTGEGFSLEHKPEGIGSARRVAFTEDDRILVTTEQGLLIQGNDGNWSKIHTQNPETDRLTALLVRSSGETWVGSSAGICALREGKLVPMGGVFEQITAPVYLLLEDPTGRVWIGTDLGVYIWDGSEMRNLTVRHGLSGREVNRGAGILDHRGRVWIGTDRGVSVYQEEYDRPLPAPNLELLSIDIDGMDHSASGNIRLEPHQNGLIFKFRAITFSKEEELQFRYQLEGFDSEAQGPAPIPASEIRYTNLAPGTYRFRISAGWPDGSWSAAQASGLITIPRPFWRTRAFYAAIIALLAGLTFGTYVLRTREMRIRSNRLEAMNLKLQEAAKEREKLISSLEAQNVELERFTFTVSHDLKSPLVTIRGFLGFLAEAREAGNYEQMDRDIARIDKAAETMGQLLDELLQLAAIGRIINLPERVSLSPLFEEILELLRGRLKERNVQIDISPDLPEVVGDRLRLRMVFQNLIDNAIKFTDVQPRPLITVQAEIQEERILVIVTDNGRGIAPEHQEQIFGLFKRLDPRVSGTGIGLALVERIVEAHHGEIWVESEGAGRGSRFVVALPKKSNAAGSPPVEH